MRPAQAQEALEARLVALLYDELSPEEAAAVRAELAADPAAAARFARWQAVQSECAALPEPEPDPQIHYDVLRAAREAVAPAPRPGLFAWLAGLQLAPALAGLTLLAAAGGLVAVFNRLDTDQADLSPTAIPVPTAQAPARAAPPEAVASGSSPAEDPSAAPAAGELRASDAPGQAPDRARRVPLPAPPADGRGLAGAKAEAPEERFGGLAAASPEASAKADAKASAKGKASARPRAKPSPQAARKKQASAFDGADLLEALPETPDRAPAKAKAPAQPPAAEPEGRAFAPPPPAPAQALDALGDATADDSLGRPPAEEQANREARRPARDRFARADEAEMAAEPAAGGPPARPASTRRSESSKPTAGAAVGFEDDKADGADPLRRARSARAAGRLRDAADAYEDAMRQGRSGPTLQRAWFEAAQTYEQLGDPGRAAQLYRLVVGAGGPDAASARQRLDALEAALKGAAPARK